MKGLNPCSFGMQIEFTRLLAFVTPACLNPCSFGMQIEWQQVDPEELEGRVLILVLLECR